MNKSKICFITCVNDERAYEECLFYISNLNIPNGIEVETISLRDSYSMTHSYNKAMKESDAKYKVYLHQDTFIINKDFIYNIIHIFEKNYEIGMLGVVGAEKLPINGVWWEAKSRIGKINDSYTGKMKNLVLNDIQDCKIVQAIDGLLMVTQYDIDWREDLFDGWHFYDISQSIEFQNRGYKVIIPKQVEPWCIHDCGIVKISNGYSDYRIKTLKNYSLVDKNNEDLFDFDKDYAKNIMYDNIETFNQHIEKIQVLLKLKDYEGVSKIAYEAAMYAYVNHPGIFKSKELEGALIECAKSIECVNLETNRQEKTDKRRVLHVVSEAYNTGGHTRLAKNWIERDDESIHSLVTTWNSNSIPSWLKDVVKASGGELFELKSESDCFMDRSEELRRIAYEFADIVVLHVHMYDPIPIIAFGVEGGPPIVYMNHADHCFWIGSSIVDICVDISKYGQLVTKNRRGIDKSILLPIPLSPTINDIDKNTIREKYNIGKDKTVLLTIASEYKFKGLKDGIDYCSVMKDVVNEFEDVVLIVIGPKDTGKWRELSELTNYKVKVMGIQENIDEFYKMSDIYIESFVVGSFTSRLDAIKYNLPALKFENKRYPSMSVLVDELEKLNCKNVNEMIFNINLLKNKNDDILEKSNYMTDLVIKNHVKNTKMYIQNIYGDCKKHTVEYKEVNNPISEYDLFWAMYNKI